MKVSYQRHALLVWRCLWWNLFHVSRSSHTCEVVTHKHMYDTNIFCNEWSLLEWGHECLTCQSVETFTFSLQSVKKMKENIHMDEFCFIDSMCHEELFSYWSRNKMMKSRQEVIICFEKWWVAIQIIVTFQSIKHILWVRWIWILWELVRTWRGRLKTPKHNKLFLTQR